MATLKNFLNEEARNDLVKLLMKAGVVVKKRWKVTLKDQLKDESFFGVNYSDYEILKDLLATTGITFTELRRRIRSDEAPKPCMVEVELGPSIRYPQEHMEVVYIYNRDLIQYGYSSGNKESTVAGQ